MSRMRKPTIVAIGAGVLAVVILAGGYLALVAPKRSKVADLERAASATQSQLTVALAQAHSTPVRSERVQIADLFRLSRAMPDSVDPAGMLLDLSRLARGSHVQLVSVAPQAPASSSSTTAPPLGYQSVEVDVQLQGRYGAVTSFLAALRRQVVVRNGALHAGGRLFGVDSLQLAAGDAGFPQVKATLTLEAYVFSAPAGVATQTMPGAPQPAPASSGGSVSAAGAGAGQ